MKTQLLGIKWPNIISGRDYSEGSYFCEIHLKIYLENEDVAAELNKAIRGALGAGQPSMRSAKTILRSELHRVGYDNEGNLALVEALKLPARPSSSGRKSTVRKTSKK